MSAERNIWFVAGDVSGDQNAGRLARAFRELAPGARLTGAGGPFMRAAGIDVQFETIDFSTVGVPGPRVIWRHIDLYRRGVFNAIVHARPDVVVLIDNEWTNLVLATLLRRRGIPVVFFFPPQVWFWGRWRLPFIVPLARRVLSAFQPEAELYRDAGADTVWIGHPLRDAVSVETDPDAELRAIGLDPTRPLIALMPGSRRHEILSLAPVMLDAARLLHTWDPSLQFAIPLATESLRDGVQHAIAAHDGPPVTLYVPESYAVLSRARVILQCSGTATVEAALLGIPAVITYRCQPLAYWFARRFMTVDYIGMANILLGEMVQPEIFQHDVEAFRLAAEAWTLHTDETRRERICRRLAEIRPLLGPLGASHRAAAALLELLDPLPQPELDSAGGYVAKPQFAMTSSTDTVLRQAN